MWERARGAPDRVLKANLQMETLELLWTPAMSKTHVNIQAKDTIKPIREDTSGT